MAAYVFSALGVRSGIHDGSWPPWRGDLVGRDTVPYSDRCLDVRPLGEPRWRGFVFALGRARFGITIDGDRLRGWYADGPTVAGRERRSWGRTVARTGRGIAFWTGRRVG